MSLLSNQGFLLAEDAALKARLVNGLRLSDDRNASRKVQVFYRYPESETERTFPFVTIELVNINHARIRQESEVTYYYPSTASGSSVSINPTNRLDYFPSEYTASDLQDIVDGSPYLATEQMIPIDLMYQVSTYCRSQRHDRELTVGMMRYVFPLRKSFIEIPEDNTSRRCDLLSWRSSDILDQESGYKKRIFRKVYTVQMNSELPQTDLLKVSTVLSGSGTLTNTPGNAPFSDTNW